MDSCYIYAMSLNDIDIRRGRDRMVVGFTTTCAISVYKPLKL
jgi:hypothetical protein